MPTYSHKNALLTVEQVLEIRRRAAAGENPKTIGPDFGKHPDLIGEVISGKRYASLPGIIKHLRRQNRALKPEVVLFLRLTYGPNVSCERLAEVYGLHKRTMARILTGDLYKDVPGPRAAMNDARKRRSLTDEQVIWARRMYRTKQWSAGMLGKELGVPRSRMLLIIRGYAYKDVPGAVSAPVRFTRTPMVRRDQRIRRLQASMSSASSTQPA